MEQLVVYWYGYQVVDGFLVLQQQVVFVDDQLVFLVERNWFWFWFWFRDWFGFGFGGCFGEDFEDFVFGFFYDWCDEVVGGKVQQVVVDDVVFELQGFVGFDWILFVLLVDCGEVFLDWCWQCQYWKIFVQYLVNCVGSLFGEGDGCVMVGQDLVLVLCWIVVLCYVGNCFEFLGDYVQYWVLQVLCCFVWWGEGEEQVVFVLFMQLLVEWVDFVCVLYQVDLFQ